MSVFQNLSNLEMHI
nr:unnamed protein product [Callosobruchus analis]